MQGIKALSASTHLRLTNSRRSLQAKKTNIISRMTGAAFHHERSLQIDVGVAGPVLEQLHSTWYSSGSSSATDLHCDPEPEIASSKSVVTRDAVAALALQARVILDLMRETQGLIKGVLLVKDHLSHVWQQKRCVTTEDGLLRAKYESGASPQEPLIRNLRGCQVHVISHDSTPVLGLIVRSADKQERIQLKFGDHCSFQSWFAALLCWRSIYPSRDLHGQKTKETGRKPPSSDIANISVTEEAVLVQSYAVFLNDYSGNRVRGQSQSPGQREDGQIDQFPDQEVLCVLHGDGTLNLHSSTNIQSQLLAIRFRYLPRSAIIRFRKKTFDQKHILGIFPQYSHSNKACARVRPVYLSYDTVEALEAWLLLLRAFASPETVPVTPPQARTSNTILPSFVRVRTSLEVGIEKLKFSADSRSNCSYNSSAPASAGNKEIQGAPVRSSHLPTTQWHASILIDGQLKAVTSARLGADDTKSQELVDIGEIPNAASMISLFIQQVQDGSRSPASCATYGRTDVPLSCLISHSELERWFPINDHIGDQVGEISLRAQLSIEHILPAVEYAKLLKLILDTSNGLTVKIWRKIPAHLNLVAQHLLDIFLASDQALDWLNYLVIGEAKESIASMEERITKSRVQSPFHQANSRSSFEEDEIQASGATNLNVLFRADTLATKAVSLYFKRSGVAYLASTVGKTIRKILEESRNCEVDPSKMINAAEYDLTRNWRYLRGLVEEIWSSISASASSCPSEITQILRHVQRYVGTLFTNCASHVVYRSISSFIFLRFFCAAIANPHQYELIEERPPPRGRRTYILVAKSIQGLANLTNFSEPWMSPMNEFCLAHHQELKDYLDILCSTACSNGMAKGTSSTEPANSTLYVLASSIHERLTPKAREGCLTLPYLIDQPGALSALAKLWTSNFKHTWSCGYEHSPQNAPSRKGLSTPYREVRTVTLKTLVSTFSGTDEDDDLVTFHLLCQSLCQRTAKAIEHMDNGVALAGSAREATSENEFTDDCLDMRWVETAEQIELTPEDFCFRGVPNTATSFLDDSDSDEAFLDL